MRLDNLFANVLTFPRFVNIKILLVDDHSLVRDGVRALLEREREFRVVGEAQDGRSAIEQALKVQPDVVVMDIAMPDLNGIEATRQLVARIPQIKVIGLSAHVDKRFVLEMLRAGAAGYLQKDCAYRSLVQAIRTVAGGHSYLTPEITGAVVETVRQQTPPEADESSDLSPKEREVLQLLAEGCTTKEIADRLKVSGKTIDTHRQHVMDKLRLRSIAELTKYAIRHGLTSLEH